MSRQPENQGTSARYEIRIKGHLDSRWAVWFEGLTIIRDAGEETLLTGAVVDQAALHGLLRKVRDLGVTLVSVRQIEAGEGNSATAGSDSAHRDSEQESKPYEQNARQQPLRNKDQPINLDQGEQNENYII